MATIKVTVFRTRWIDSCHYAANETYDMQEEHARQLIKDGDATEVAVSKKETAQAKHTGKETK